MTTSAPLRVALLGCTGSIGSSAVTVARAHTHKIQITALAAHSDIEGLIALAREFNVKHLALANEALASDPRVADAPAPIAFGAEAVCALAALDEVDCVLNAVVGFAGIDAALTALRAHKRLAYANKESIVVGGDLLMPLAAPGQIIPVDSEHSAIFQSLETRAASAECCPIHALWLTCSGGPFRGRSRAELERVTVDDALAHPTWQMGAKITIDSATLMNKGLEILEARHLFGVGIDDIRVLIHPQSKIHSGVEFSDGSFIAQLGPSEMALPIQYAFSYPERWDTPVARVNWAAAGTLSFDEPDTSTFGCLELARAAGRLGKTAPCVLNAANEVANEAFRARRIGFLDIERVVAATLEASSFEEPESVAHLHEVDAAARAYASALVDKLSASLETDAPEMASPETVAPKTATPAASKGAPCSH